MGILADMIEDEFKGHSIGRADSDGETIIHVWHLPDPDAKVLIHLASPTVLVSVAKRPEGTENSVYEPWVHCTPVSLHLSSPSFWSDLMTLARAFNSYL